MPCLERGLSYQWADLPSQLFCGIEGHPFLPLILSFLICELGMI